MIKGDLSCNSKNIIYLTTCDKCKDEYIGSAVDFRPCIRVHNSDIKTKKERCGTSRHFNKKCLCSTSDFGYAKVKVIEHVYSEHPSKIEEVLWYSALLYLYSKNREGYRKYVETITLLFNFFRS